VRGKKSQIVAGSLDSRASFCQVVLVGEDVVSAWHDSLRDPSVVNAAPCLMNPAHAALLSAACESDEQLIGISVLLVSGGIEVWLALGRPQGLRTCLVRETKKFRDTVTLNYYSTID